MGYASNRVMTIALVIIAAILGAGALYWLRPVMIPFILAVLLSYALSPIVDVLNRKLRLPRTAAIFTAVCLGLLLFAVVGGVISSSVRDIAKNSATYQQRITELGILASDFLREHHLEAGAQSLEQQMNKLPVGQAIAQTANGLIDTLSNAFLILIFAIYLLQGRAQRVQSQGLKGEIEGRIKRYLVIKFALSAATGGLTAAILAILEVQAALVFGLLAFGLNFIPSAGSLFAILLPIPMVLLDPLSSTMTIVLVIALPTLVQIVIGNIIEPKIMGDSLQLHPITILLALVFWGMLWGIPGMLLATPISAAMRILFDSSPGTQPLARLMAGQWSAETHQSISEGLLGPPDATH
ncbi:MAG: AI-2E family transporter [Myxococcota bacterium]|nr:AI-2E family transporter [Myxococcota bacterium]